MYNFSSFFSCVGSRASTRRGAFGGRARGERVRGNNDGCNRLGFRLTDASTPRKRRMNPHRWRECFKTKSARTL